MSREVRRVPTDFDWPLSQTWQGYLMPAELRPDPCPPCDGGGYSPQARHLHDLWYGHVPFRPQDNGSTPLTESTPAVRAIAEHHIAQAPDFYGTGEAAIAREGRRLARLWNSQWCHHLNQDDVDALLAEGRLRDFTHTWTRETRWQPRDPAPTVTPEQVNTWSLRSFGHDSLNAHYVIQARVAREGHPYTCDVCAGTGNRWRDADHQAAHDAWEPTPPPTGDGWQLWETVSEGSPVSPVFPDRAGLVGWLTTDYRTLDDEPLTPAQAEKFVDAGSSLGSFYAPSGGGLVDGDGPAVTEPEKDPLRAAVTALHQWWKDYPTSDATDEEFALWTALGDQLRPLREARDAQLDAAPVAGPEPGPPTSQWYLVSYTFPTGAGHLEVGLPGGWIARSTADAVAQTITAAHPQVRRKDVVITGLCPIGPPAPSRPQPVFPLTPAPEETP